jgi:hypothetical protein
MTTGRINQVVNYRGRGTGSKRRGGGRTPRCPTASRGARGPSPFPASARGRRRVSETSEAARVRGPGSLAAPVARRAKDTRRSAWPSCLLPLSIRKLPRSQRCKRARSRLPRTAQRGADPSDGQRGLSAGCTFVCSTTAKGAQPRLHSPTLGRLSHSQLDHGPLGPAVKGHLAPITCTNTQRESIQVPALSSTEDEAPSTASARPEGKVLSVEAACRQVWLDALLRLTVLADTLSEADYLSPRY